MKEKVVTAISTIKLLCELKKWQSLISFHCWYGVCVSVMYSVYIIRVESIVEENMR